jgi:hypothetical protein
MSLLLNVLCLHLANEYTVNINCYLSSVFSICCFGSIIDLLIGLENDDVISGFVTFYLKDGEPYLRSAYGTMICYWDGIGHYVMYLMMLSAMAWK